MEDEEFEHIPWSHLAAGEDDRRSRLIYLAVGAVALAVVGVVGARWFTSPSHGEVPVAPPVTSEPSAANEDRDVITVSSSAETMTSLLSEADLMAAAPTREATEMGDAEAMATMRAEWFVTDYFTVDHDPSAAAELVGSFSTELELPELPHLSSEQSGTSYVEWSRAYRVDDEGDDIFAVAVAFRAIYLDESGEFRRSPVRAVQVLVAVGDDTAGVVDLPTPVVPPLAGDSTAVGVPVGEASTDAVESALAYSWLFDEEPSVLEAAEEAGEWRVVVGLRDGSGIMWPMVVRSDLLER